MIAADDIQNESFVRFGQREIVFLLVRHVQLARHRHRLDARRLHVHLHVDRRVGLHAQHELVPIAVLEQRTAHILELDPDLRLRLVQPLSALQIERNAVPSRRVDRPTSHHASPRLQHRRREGGRERVAGHGGVVEVAGLRGVGDVLAHDRAVQSQRRDGLQHAHLLVADVRAVQRERLLHADQRDDLEKVVLHHVADDAVMIEVPAAAVHTQRFFEDDLDVVDVVAVPDRAENHVREPSHH